MSFRDSRPMLNRSMGNNITPENWPDIARHVHSQTAAHVRPYLASISKTQDNQNGKAHGSGVYLEVKERHYLLTCEHVVQKGYSDGYRIAHLPTVGGYYCAFNNPWFFELYPLDLALTYIDPGIWSGGDRMGLAASRIAPAHDAAPNELLVLCGYPGAASYFTRFTGEPVLDSHLIPYTARETALPEGYDPDIHFALQYEMDLAEPADGS